MLKFIRLKNFRAYKDQTFNFRKLNFFIGANNSGKSSILSAINLISQTINANSRSSSPLILNGPYEELGTYQDIVHGNNVKTSMGFDVGFDNFEYSIEVKYRFQRREIELTKFVFLENRKELYSYVKRSESVDIKIKKVPIEQILNVRSLRGARFFGFLPRPLDLYPLFLTDEKISSEISTELRELSQKMRRAQTRFQESFRNFDTLSPFRDQPKRTYVYTGETPSEVGRTGSNGITLLANDSSRRGSQKIGLEQEISKWLQVNNIASAIKVKNLTSRHFEVCVVDFKQKEHNICDVGFGCSQVLPVLVGGLNLFRGVSSRSRMQPTFVVQEPEIHLHPNAQASLGTFFVGLARVGGQQFIETHSDNLILRVARHVTLGHFDKNLVKVFFVEDKLGDKTVTEIEIDKDGLFSPDWPGGFFPQRQSESFALAKARMITSGEIANIEIPFGYEA